MASPPPPPTTTTTTTLPCEVSKLCGDLCAGSLARSLAPSFMAVSRGDVVYQKGQSDDSDIWDDTALIKAYDKAVTSFKTALKNGTATCESPKICGETKSVNKRAKTRRRHKRNSVSPSDKWRPGDLCQAVWSEDGVVYDATIKSVDADAGTCVVVFTGYGNEDEMELADLLPPAAESAGGESDTAASCDADAASRAGKESAPSADDYEMPGRPKGGHGARKKGGHKQKQSVPPWDYPSPPLSHPPPFPGFPPYSNAWGGFPPPPPHLSAAALPMIPPPPLPPSAAFPDDDDEALGSMLMAWYMSGYHTGYYQGLKQGKKDAMAGRGPRYK